MAKNSYFKTIWPILQDAGKSLAAKWIWVLAASTALAGIVLFLDYHYEKGLGIGDSTLFTIFAIFISLIGAVIIVGALLFVVILIVGIFRWKHGAKDTVSTGNEKKDKTELSPIDVKALEPYFTAKFKGAGSNINNFQFMIDRLETDRTASAATVGKIAYLIYKSDVMSSNKPNSFSKWLSIFFPALGLDVPRDTSKNKYQFASDNDNDAKMKQRYQILF